MMHTKQSEEVLRFWFPDSLDCDQVTIARQWEWWFRGGADTEITEQFSRLLERAIQGELAAWADEPRSRLALIILLDQFSRSQYRGTAQAFAQDSQACTLAISGIEQGHYAALATVWEKTFFSLPLGHSEDLKNLDRVVTLTTELEAAAPQQHRPWLAFSAEQARRHRDVIAQFGRHPHRNEILGRASTAAELEYLAKGQLVHTRSLPPHLTPFCAKS